MDDGGDGGGGTILNGEGMLICLTQEKQVAEIEYIR